MNSCQSIEKKAVDDTIAKATLMQLLESIEKKDANALADIMSASDKMDLIFTNGIILPSVDSFVEFHRGWFQDTTWTIRHELVDFEFYGNFATATVKAYYNEPDRNGKPYFHNMVVSYVLQKSAVGNWMIIKDQATSFDKSE